jgi:hypothetical protein
MDTTGKAIISTEIYGSYMSTPTRDSMNFTGGPQSNLQLGEWNILYYITTDTNTNYTINVPILKNCVNQTAGENCMYPLYSITTSIANPAVLSPAIQLTQGHWVFYSVEITAPDAFWVSVAAMSPNTLADLDVYVKVGAVPGNMPDTYDIKNCNYYGGCGYATIINLNNTASSLPYGTKTTYFVGINALKNVTYNIWWSSTCAPLCITANDQESGVCSYSGSNIGQCSCEDGFMGFDCSLATGTLPTQYIVLIIIASLVVLSALIGFFAWAYMQRKREGYSSLS